LRVSADYSFQNCPPIDILVIPGGIGTRNLLDHQDTISWIRIVAQTTKLTTSVCTGAMLLAKSGILNNKRATTHWASLDWLAQQPNNISVDRTLRWVEDGNVVTSAGVSAGIDMAFHVVQRFCGKDVADDTAQHIEYPRRLATDPRTTTIKEE
jgi:transcriptional regulator GlxA family with amidase domain